jgi:hypothetical protein
MVFLIILKNMIQDLTQLLDVKTVEKIYGILVIGHVRFKKQLVKLVMLQVVD